MDIEKRNSGTFFPKDKFLYAFEAKAMKKIRYCWLWVAFFILIFGIILMYSFIYINFNLGTKYECIMMSLEAYFIGSSNNMYVMTETIVAFFINTLYISNIVKLILEPKLKDPDI
ncbi:hypothetical protein FMM75_05350 [Lachnospiraceae bacterium MD335]|nr:hypothetical protein [Lachnospiraceae bacterium MD335]